MKLWMVAFVSIWMMAGVARADRQVVDPSAAEVSGVGGRPGASGTGPAAAAAAAAPTKPEAAQPDHNGPAVPSQAVIRREERPVESGDSLAEKASKKLEEYVNACMNERKTSPKPESFLGSSR